MEEGNSEIQPAQTERGERRIPIYQGYLVNIKGIHIQESIFLEREGTHCMLGVGEVFLHPISILHSCVDLESLYALLSFAFSFLSSSTLYRSTDFPYADSASPTFLN